MCGIICGNLSSSITESTIKQSLSTLQHRGPDESNYIKKNDIFLGHTRLAITDTLNGHQPIFNEDNSICCVVNGEFYGYASIKKELIEKDHIFKSGSDSEILIHLYEEYGTDCLAYLHGEFAFVLYDFNQELWFCARDRIGIRPLQYYWYNNQFLIASEAKAILSFNIESEFNKKAFWFSQHLQYLPLDQTLFTHINMIKPAHYLIFKKDQQPIQVEYWSFNHIPEQKLSFNDATEKIRELLTQAVKKRIPNEVKWATHLSGGIDSSIVTALSRNYTSQLNAFTIQFIDGNFYDETPYATETAKYLDINLNVIPISQSDILSHLVSAILCAEGLSINGHISAKYLLNQAIKKAGFKVALSGEGSDEIFMGYSHLKQDYLSKSALNPLENNYLSGVQLPEGLMLDTSIIDTTFNFVPTWVQAKASMGYKFSQLWHPSFKFDINPYAEICNEMFVNHSNLKKASSSWMKYCLNGYILKVLDDAQAMAHSIEGRLPFLDTQLVEFMYSLSDNLYFKDNVEKILLKETFKEKLPSSIINKTKQSFMAPPINSIKTNKVGLALIEEYIIENEHLHQLNIYNKQKLIQYIMLSEHSSDTLIMTLLSVGILIKHLFP